jgi:DNA-binding CsgD family transcriptional regulator
MYISAKTVKAHIARIQRKLGVRDRVGIANRVWSSHRTL